MPLPTTEARARNFDYEEQLMVVDDRIAAVSDAAARSQLLFKRACLLENLDRRDEAKKAYLTILQVEPLHFGARNNLGLIFHARTQWRSAIDTYNQLVTNHPDNPIASANLAHTLLAAGDLEKALREYHRAIQLDPENAATHHGLATVFERMGDADGARRHRVIGYLKKPISHWPYRGIGNPIRLLTLTTADVGNVSIEMYRDSLLFDMHILISEAFNSTQELPPHDILFNAVGEADHCAVALEAARVISNRTNAPVINNPEAVRATGRIENSARLANIPGVVCAYTVAFTRAFLTNDNIDIELASRGFVWPLLLRSPGFHMGQHFVKVETANNFADALARLPGDTILVMQFIDTRSADNAIRKYRVMIIDGNFYPAHVAISQEWKVHYFSADMAESAENRAEDEIFLQDMRGVLGPRIVTVLEAIRDTLALDYVGIDFGIDASENVVVFEANATMTILAPEHEVRWGYRREPVARIHRAVRKMLVSRAYMPNSNTPPSDTPVLNEAAVPNELLEKIILAAQDEFGPSLVAVFLAGSRLSGEWHPASDLDVHIVHSGAWQQKRIIGPPDSLFGITIDLAIVPADTLYEWVTTSQMHAAFYAEGYCVYPRSCPEQMATIIEIAKHTRTMKPANTYESEEHYQRFVQLRRAIDGATDANANDQRSAAGHVLAEIAALRLFLGGVHHVKEYALYTQLENIDVAFAMQYNDCLLLPTPDARLDVARKLLEELKPDCGSIVGAAY
jgi:tetratricopeptide (TPR) repeat protein